MRKYLIYIMLLLFFCLVLFSHTTYALYDNDGEYSNIINEECGNLKINELLDKLPDNVENDLKTIGINSFNMCDIQKFSIVNFFKFLFDKTFDIVKKPFFLFASCFAIILLCSLFDGLKTTVEASSLSGVLNSIASICTCGVVVAPIVACILNVAQTIKAFGNFMLCFIPVFGAAIAISGGESSSLGYSTNLFFISQIVSLAISNFLLPAIGIFLALSIVSSLNRNFNIGGIISSIKKTVIFILSLMLIVFVGLFTMQNAVSVSADEIGMKVAKFASSSFIPIIGGSLGDAMSTVVGCLMLIKSAVGGFGILACIVTLLPSILMLIFFIISISLTGGLAQALNVSSIANMMCSIKDSLSILLAFLISYCILIISTTSLMITVAKS